MNRGKPWTEEEERKIVEKLAQHYSIDQIAQLHGRTTKAIEMRVGSLLRREQQKKSCSLSEMARAFSLSETQVHSFLQQVEEIPSDKKKAEDPHLRRLQDQLDRIEKRIHKVYKHITKKD